MSARSVNPSDPFYPADRSDNTNRGPAVNLERIEAALPMVRRLLAACSLCGHRCGVDRVAGQRGFCRAGGPDCDHARVSSHTLHFGEEPPLVGGGGSGTVFLTHCNLRCVFCQNHQISQAGLGEDMHFTRLAHVFLSLQEQGAENINLVTPTHYIYPILLALRDACREGLSIPLVYNTNGFDSLELLRLLDGIVDIYLPDMKYTEPAHAEKYSSALAYPEVAKAALREMYRQAGPLKCSEGAARRGLIIRHLVLPENLANSYDFLLWLKDVGITDATIGLMSQYSPQHRASEFPELRQTISREEYLRIVEYATDLDFPNILAQGADSPRNYLPDFRKKRPFE